MNFPRCCVHHSGCGCCRCWLFRLRLFSIRSLEVVAPVTVAVDCNCGGASPVDECLVVLDMFLLLSFISIMPPSPGATGGWVMFPVARSWGKFGGTAACEIRVVLVSDVGMTWVWCLPTPASSNGRAFNFQDWISSNLILLLLFEDLLHITLVVESLLRFLVGASCHSLFVRLRC